MAKTSLQDLLNKRPGTLSRAEISLAQKLIKEDRQFVENTMAADQMAGAGYPIDKQTRAYLKEANQEVFADQDPPHPKLWDVISAYFQWQKAEMKPFLRMRPEKDHAFNSVDFFAFATDPNLLEQTIPRLMALEEGVIHNYSVLNELKEVVFATEDGRKVAFAGISFVRQGTQLFWTSAGGEITDLAALTAQRRGELAKEEARIRQVNAGASEKMLNNILKPTALPLPGTDDVWNCGALGSFDLVTRKHEIRILTKEWEVSQAVFSDQFEYKLAMEYQQDENIKRMIDKTMLSLEKDQLFFEVAETAFTLPAYFAAKVTYVAPQTIETKLGDKNGGHQRRLALKAPLDMRIQTRTVSTLDFQNRGTYERDYTPPRFQVELDGFWRRISPESVGRNKHGEPTIGRTWVTGHTRWKDKPPRKALVHIKTTILSAFQRANKMENKYGGEVGFSAG
jgi:hypothetical protein